MTERTNAVPEPLGPQHITVEFESGVAALDEWLKKYGLHNQTNGYTRTFVLTAGNELKVIGYYSLAIGIITRAEAPKRVAGHGSPPDIPIALLARLTISKEWQGKGLSRSLLRSAFMNAVSASQHVAFRAIVVDALDERRASFYERFGFTPTKIHPLKLILPMQDVIASLNATL